MIPYTMALSPPTPTTTNAKKQMANAFVPQLLTPEEPMSDCFVRPMPVPQSYRNAAPSPPESPALQSLPGPSAFSQSDDLLYPDHNTDNIHAEKPLFGSSQTADWTSPRHRYSPVPDRLPSSPRSPHDSRYSASPNVAPKQLPQTEAIGPVALNNKFGFEYYRHCLAQLEEDRARFHRTLPAARASRAPGRDQYTQQQVSSLGRHARIEKPKPSHKATPKLRVSPPVASPPVKTDSSMIKRTRRQATTPDAFTSVTPFQQTPAPKPRTRAAPSKRVDDKDASDWADLPDYCPPLSSLDTTGRKLHAAWTNTNALDLSNDPDRENLHPQEIEVASTLRLRCNQYLSNKRRIFAAKVELMRANKDFNKTSAQTCCKIDVNKASKLWQTFKDIGWLDDHWFQQYL